MYEVRLLLVVTWLEQFGRQPGVLEVLYGWRWGRGGRCGHNGTLGLGGRKGVGLNCGSKRRRRGSRGGGRREGRDGRERGRGGGRGVAGGVRNRCGEGLTLGREVFQEGDA